MPKTPYELSIKAIQLTKSHASQLSSHLVIKQIEFNLVSVQSLQRMSLCMHLKLVIESDQFI
jgi:hypothetical protein